MLFVQLVKESHPPLFDAHTSITAKGGGQMTRRDNGKGKNTRTSYVGSAAVSRRTRSAHNGPSLSGGTVGEFITSTVIYSARINIGAYSLPCSRISNRTGRAVRRCSVLISAIRFGITPPIVTRAFIYVYSNVKCVQCELGIVPMHGVVPFP